MKQAFGTLPTGESASLYTISLGPLTAKVTDLGATLVSLYVPDRQGVCADVVLGFDSAAEYVSKGGIPGATVGRNANRIKGAAFCLGGKRILLTPNEAENNLHSGPDSYAKRLWRVREHTSDSISFLLESPDGDQGFPGNARITVTYTLENPTTLRIRYDALCDKDTVLNMTNHSYFNLAGHEKPELAMAQTLILPARFFVPADAQSIPTGELRSVIGTPMDFRIPKTLGQDIDANYMPLRLAGGYDHSFEVYCAPCAILSDPHSGRTMAVSTDCPGIQVYTGNSLNMSGKGGVFYGKHSGVALEPQFYPDSVNHPEWPQPFTPAGTPYHSETIYQFTV